MCLGPGMRAFWTRGARGLIRAGVRSIEHGSGIGGCVQPDVIVVGVEGGRVSGGVDRGPGLTASTTQVGSVGAARAGFGRTRGGRLTRLGDPFTIAT